MKTCSLKDWIGAIVPFLYRDLEEITIDCGVEVDHSTINRWVLKYAPELDKRYSSAAEADERFMESGRDLHQNQR